MDNPITSAFYTVLTALFGVGLNLIELAIVDPQRLNTDPFDVLAVQYELLIASGGMLLGAHFVASSELSGRINRPLLGLLFSFMLVYILLAISARPWRWVESFDVVLTVALPDLIGIVMLGWSVLVARGIAIDG